MDYHQEQWLDWLGTAEFAYNNKVNSSTNILPFIVAIASFETNSQRHSKSELTKRTQ